MGDYWSMGEFAAGMGDAGTVSGVHLAGNRRAGHWSWDVNRFIVQLYPASCPPRCHVPRRIAARLLIVSLSVR